MDEPINILQKYRIGSLDQRVQILAPTETQNADTGEITQTWGEYAIRNAQVTPLGGNEQLLGDMLLPISRVRMTFRYDSTITEKFRLVWNSHTYNITSIDVVPRNRFLIIIAESMSLSGSEGVDYGDYYSKNSLKLRYIVGRVITGIRPSQIELNQLVGMTAAAAGIGYTFECEFTYHDNPLYLIVWSNGAIWINIAGNLSV